jgi:hypothetical protein
MLHRMDYHMNGEPIDDYIVISVPPNIDPEDPGFHARMENITSYQIMAQYKGQRPRALVMDPVEWTVTSDWRDVEQVQPTHDCPTCRAGQDQAIAYLKEHPEGRLALGNMRYWEVW